MLTHYLELRAIAQIEIKQVDVINQIMQSLHQIFVTTRGNIGISFPAYSANQRIGLGGVIRLFGSEQELQKVEETINLSSISDYVWMQAIMPLPSNVSSYLHLSRVRQKGQSDLRRAEKRLTAQDKWSQQVKNSMIEKWGSVILTYPHVQLTSKSTGQQFMLWIKQQKCKQQVEGTFNAYGLSQTATVPDF